MTQQTAAQSAEAYLTRLGAALWPGATTVLTTSGRPFGRRSGRGLRRRAVPRRGRRGAAAGSRAWEYFVLPSAASPRLLLPVAPAAAAAGALRRYGEQSSALARARMRLASVVVRCGVAGVVLRTRVHVDDSAAAATSIERHIQEILGDVVMSISVGKPRANRKPVLQVLDRRGRTVAFAKVGVDELTRGLVVAEREALEALAAVGPEQRLRLTQVPAVLHADRWHGLEVLVQSALPVWRRRAAPDEERLHASMSEVAHVHGLTPCALADSAYWRSLRRRVDALADAETAAALREASTTLATRAGATTLRFGAWHGDWTPWNMAFLDDVLLVWDWERFGAGVPLGFDAVHYALQDLLVTRQADPFAAALACVDGAAEVLDRFDVGGREEARTTAMLYLLEIASRYCADGQEAAGARRGDLRTWLLPALRERSQGGDR